MRSLVLISVALLACTSACAANPQPPTATECVLPPPAARAESCPLGVDGAGVEVTEVDGGILLTFTSHDRVEEVRRRTHAAAEIHGTGEHKGLGHKGHHGEGVARPGFHHGLQAVELPPARLAAEDAETGARLRLTAVFPGDVESLRAKVRERAEAMRACR